MPRRITRSFARRIARSELTANRDPGSAQGIAVKPTLIDDPAWSS